MNVPLVMVDVKFIVLILKGHLHALVIIMKYLMTQDYSVLVCKHLKLSVESNVLISQITMSVPLVLITVSRFVVIQSHTGVVAATLATVYVLIAEHVKVLISIKN